MLPDVIARLLRQWENVPNQQRSQHAGSFIEAVRNDCPPGWADGDCNTHIGTANALVSVCICCREPALMNASVLCEQVTRRGTHTCQVRAHKMCLRDAPAIVRCSCGSSFRAAADFDAPTADELAMHELMVAHQLAPAAEMDAQIAPPEEAQERPEQVQAHDMSPRQRQSFRRNQSRLNTRRALDHVAEQIYVSPAEAARLASETILAAREAIRARFTRFIPTFSDDDESDAASAASDGSFERHFAAQMAEMNLEIR